MFRAKGKLHEAVDRYSQALELNSDYQEGLYNVALLRAELAVRNRDDRSAVSYFSKDLQIDPAETRLYFNIGLIDKKELKNYRLARWDLQSCLKPAPATELAKRAQAELEQSPLVRGKL